MSLIPPITTHYFPTNILFVHSKLGISCARIISRTSSSSKGYQLHIYRYIYFCGCTINAGEKTALLARMISHISFNIYKYKKELYNRQKKIGPIFLVRLICIYRKEQKNHVEKTIKTQSTSVFTRNVRIALFRLLTYCLK